MRHAPARFGARFNLVASAITVGLVTGLALVSITTTTATAKAPATSKIYFGAAGDYSAARTGTGVALAQHAYGYFTDKTPPSARMITVKFKDKKWSQTAALTSGSTDYQNVVRWADALKTRGEVLLAFHHEPEKPSNDTFGTADQFKAAFRKIVDIFRARGADNVAFTLQTTAYAFSVDSSDDRAISKWYPGDNYVDVVAADPYNWYTCGHGTGKWSSLEQLTRSVVDFAKAHGKQVALAEFASVRDSRRPQWIRDAGAYLAANDNVFVAAFYFNRAPTNKANSDCTWPLSTTGDFAAMRDVFNGTAFKG